MQTQRHTSFVTVLVGAALALAVVAPSAFAGAPAESRAFPSAVPSQPGALTGSAADTNAARAQERYYSSYRESKPLTPLGTPVDDGGVDWASIGIAIGGTVLLVGAVARAQES